MNWGSVSKPSFFLFAVPVLVLILGVWNIGSELDAVAKRANETFERNFTRDAMRREGMRNILTNDVREFLQQALKRVAMLDLESANDDALGDLLENAFQSLDLHLDDPRYAFFRVLLLELPADQRGRAIVRRAYPTDPSLEGKEVGSHPILLNFDPTEYARFESSNYLSVFNPDPLLAIEESQPVVVRRLMVKPGSEMTSSWVLVVSAGLSAVHRSIDYVGTGMLDGATQILVKTFQPGTERCMFMYEVRVGPRSCDHPTDGSLTAYRTANTTASGDIRVVSDYLPSSTYRSLQDLSVVLPNLWSLALPIVAAFILFFATLFSQGQRRQMSDRLRVTQQSLDDSQALSLSVFETMTARLHGMVEFVWSMHQRDPEGSEGRYYRLAAQDFAETWLNLDKHYLAQQAHQRSLGIANWETLERDRLNVIADRTLKVVTTDSDVEARLLIDNEFPSEIQSSGYWAAAALAGAIMASGETTETGFIEVRIWAEPDKDNKTEVFFSVHDTGIGWSIADQHSSDSEVVADDSEAVSALKMIVERTTVALVHERLSPTGNDHRFKVVGS